MELKGLNALAEVATKKVQTLTFNLSDVAVKVAGNGNVGYRAKLSDGTYVSFWKSTMMDVIEETDVENIFRLKVGTGISNQPDRGLIDPTKVAKSSFWGV